MLKSLARILRGFSSAPGDGQTILHPSNTCPECGSKLCKTGGWGERAREPLGVADDGSPGVSPQQRDEWRCPNPDCPQKVRASLEHWCSGDAMNVEGGSKELVAQLVNSGLVRDVAELYRLKAAEIAALEGMNEQSAARFFDAIVASNAREAWRVLHGLDIPHIGAEAAQSLCRRFATLDDIFAAGTKRLMEADGISEGMAQSILRWYSDSMNRKLLGRLRKAELNFKAGLSKPAS